MTTSADRDLNGHSVFEGINGRDVLGARTNAQGTVVVTKPRWGWTWFHRGQRTPPAPAKRDGSRLIALSAALLTLLAVGLLAVSVAAQYRYFLGERHQVTASMIESGALDLGMLVFSLLALGLARKGLPARPERVLIVACATTSAVMNYAPAQAGDWRSVLAWTMPPVFLAVVADRVIAVTRRHFLGMAEDRSAWRDGLGWTGTAVKVTGLGLLYALRVPLAPVSTGKGLRLAVLSATPLPEAPDRQAIEAPRESAAKPAGTGAQKPRSGRPRGTPGRNGPSKKAVLLDLYRQHEGYGERARVSRIAAELAPQAGLQAGTARTYLLGAVHDALPAGEGDSK